MFKVYPVLVTADCEGRSTRRLGVFKNETDAQRVADTSVGDDMGGSKGWVGSSFWVYESIEESQKVHLDEIKEKALAKLSDIEKEVLGLT